MRRSRKTKILATLGPSSNSEAHLKALFNAGADVFRINMSHTSHEDLARLVGIVRSVETNAGRPIAALVDLQVRNCASVSWPTGQCTSKMIRRLY
jgi:pyruvate kinase